MAINLNKFATGVLDMLNAFDKSWATEDIPTSPLISDFTAVLAYTSNVGKIHACTTLYTNQHSEVCVDSIVHGLISQVSIDLRDIRECTVVINPTQFAGQEEWVRREVDRRILLARSSYLDGELISETARKGDERLLAAIHEMKGAQSNG